MSRLDSFQAIDYWMADNPLSYPGNPDSPANPVYNDPYTGYASYNGYINDTDITAPTHVSAIEFEGEWYFFYQRGDVNSGSYVRRSSCVEKMVFNADGTIQEIVYTLGDDAEEGVVEAEAFTSQSGIQDEANILDILIMTTGRNTVLA